MCISSLLDPLPQQAGARENGLLPQQRKGVSAGNLSRRRFLGSSLALLGGGVLRPGVARGAAAPEEIEALQDSLPPVPVARQCPAAVPVPGQGGVPLNPYCAPATGDRIILLGVQGGELATPFANQPAQVLVVNDNAYVIDFGTGVTREIVLAGLDVTGIRHSFLTHLHMDHILEYPGLMIVGWFQDLILGDGQFKVDAWGPVGLGKLTDDFLSMYQDDLAFRAEVLNATPLADRVRPHEFAFDHQGLILENDDVVVRAAPVIHPPLESFAYRFETANSTVVFSGDTAYSENLVDLATGADWLVHEAVYIPDLRRLGSHLPEEFFDFFTRIHTPADQVGRVAAEAGVKHLVLNHLVPIVTRDDVWIREVRKHYSGDVIIGMDRMQFPLSIT